MAISSFRVRNRILAAGAGLALLIAPVTAFANGNVQVGDVDGNGQVGIGGDSGDNDITITQSGNVITITGNNGTTVNGGASVMRTASRIRIRMMDGNDTVKLDGVSVDDVNIKDKKGNNTTTVTGSTVEGRVKIKHGSGNDTVNITDSVIETKEIKLDGGTDTYNGNSTSSDRGNINTGDGFDGVYLWNVSYGNKLVVSLGRGNDMVSVGDSYLFRSRFLGQGGDDCFWDTGGNSYNGLPFCESSESSNGFDIWSLKSLFHGGLESGFENLFQTPRSRCTLKSIEHDSCSSTF